MDDPQYIVLVALDTPSRETGIYISGGVMAAPTVGAVMGDILPYLGVAQNYGPDDPAGQSVKLEDLTGLTAKEAEKKLKALGLSHQAVGSGETVTGQIPAAGNEVPGGSQVLLYFGEATPMENVKVPDFGGMNRQQAADAATELGLYILVGGNTDLKPTVKAASQDVAPGTEVPRGTTIKIEFIDTKAN
jgi:stage V sporulation protein D (sporulation-specific penicillin-binding protein)